MTDQNDFSEREKAIIQSALLHMATDSMVNGEYDQAADCRKLADKVDTWRDDETYTDHR